MREPAEAEATTASARQKALQGRGDRPARPDLVGGSGCYEIAYQEPGRAPRLLLAAKAESPPTGRQEEVLWPWWVLENDVRWV